MRAKACSTHWIEELYGYRPAIITAAIARITNELMIEEVRQQRMADAKAARKYLDPDMPLKIDPNAGYGYIIDQSIEISF